MRMECNIERDIYKWEKKMNKIELFSMSFIIIIYCNGTIILFLINFRKQKKWIIKGRKALIHLGIKLNLI